ncbi:PREDICTED: ELMO domain-containing protein 1-like [Amphimedon queenslandica]|uniref:ELMO domain-containing protein n=1 Tax=Amphimedon queenslandica TaxID=400682 RepID=A0A1X7UMH6_AMPQE|nr:PREDICTED: ELMO domain-containing protein 1-like [Amphimedon queenslandica]|eukprot:XP_003387436.1 PREDICTED: ELMO domain-containing protein 1-like [Amphimedon queenslandica]
MPLFFPLYFWRLYKWLLRLLTRKCELLRICEGTADLASRTFAVARSLKNSKHKELQSIAWVTPAGQDVIDPDDALNLIIKTKKISTEKHPNFVSSIKPCLLPIIALSALKGDIEKMKFESYLSENDEHEQQLTKLWSLLVPQTELKARFGTHWGTIGFQGKDPATDFRGMGMLGLYCLVYFAEMHSGKARQVLGFSQHPTKGYPLAITSINITQIVYSLLLNSHLDYYLYLKSRGNVPTINDFMEAHCYVMYSFNQFWLDSNPENIMAFSRVRDRYLSELKRRLEERPLTIELSLEDGSS